MFIGLSAFPLTPMDGNGRVKTDQLQALLEPILGSGATSIGLLGSTGAYMYLTAAERLRAIEAAKEVCSGRIPLIVGVGALRTDHSVELAQSARTAGADGLLLAPVSYTPLTQDEAMRHYQAVADATDLPLVIYNNPGTTHFTFSQDLIADLARHPKIDAIKMPPSADIPAELRELGPRVPDGFAIGYSGEAIMPDACRAGSPIFFSGLAGILPTQMQALFDAACGQDQSLERSFHPLWDLCKRHGTIRVVYAIAKMRALPDILPPAPLLPLADDVCAQVEAALNSIARAMAG